MFSRRIGLFAFGAVVALTVAGSASSAKPKPKPVRPKPGQRCAKAGKRTGYPHGTLVCAHKGGKLVWTLKRQQGSKPAPPNGGGSSSGGASRCSASPSKIVNDVRVCSHGSPSQPNACTITANIGSRIDEAFAIDPADPKVLYVGVERLGLFKSTDGGATWKLSSTGLIGYPRQDDPTKPCIEEMGKIVIDPANPNHLLLSRVDNPGTLSGYFSENAGVFESTDAGAHWRQTYNNPAMNTYVRTGLAFGTSTTWYTGSYDQGPDQGGAPPNTVGIVYKTADGGRTWTELPTGLQLSTGVQQLFVKPGDPNTVIAFTFNRPYGVSTFGEGLGTIMTTDGGRTWSKLENNLPPGAKAPEDVDVAPGNFSHVFLITFNDAAGYSSQDGGRTFARTGAPGLLIARYAPSDGSGNSLLGADSSGGIYASADNGLTWSRRSTLPAGPAGMETRVSVIRWDPSSTGTVYAGGAYQSSAGHQAFLFRSTDDGASWQSVLDTSTLKP